MKRLVSAALILLMLLASYGCSDSKDTATDNPDKDHTSSLIHKHPEEPEDVTEEVTEKAEEEEEVVVDYRLGQVITFGRYEQDADGSNGTEILKWVVADIKGDSYLLVSSMGIDCMPYNTKAGEVTWEDSSIRHWLNSDFYDKTFTDKEKEHIKTTDVVNADNPETGADGGSDTEDKVFLLSQTEAASYFSNDTVRLASATEYAKSQGAYTETADRCGWWLRSPGASNKEAVRVNIHGQILTSDSSEGGVERGDFAVRPAMWVEA